MTDYYTNRLTDYVKRRCTQHPTGALTANISTWDVLNTLGAGASVIFRWGRHSALLTVAWVSSRCSLLLTFWHRSFIFNSNKSATWCNNFSVYYPDVCLQLMFRAFSRPSSGAQWLQWQPLVLPSYSGDSRAVFGRPDHEHSTTVTTIRR